MLQLVFLLLLPVMKPQVTRVAGMVGRASMVLYTGERGEVNLVTAVWNIVMASMQCCGVESYTDFNSTRWQQTRIGNQVLEI